jgi:Ca2+/Na+ antiporter
VITDRVMDFEVLLQQVFGYAQHNMTVVLVAAALLALLTFFKPKSMMKLYGFLILAVVGFYLLSLLKGALFTGADQKHKMIYKSRDVVGE